MPLEISCASQSAVVLQLTLKPQPARQVVPNSSVSAHIVATLPLPQGGAEGKQDTVVGPSPPQHVPAQQLPPFVHSPALSHLWRVTAASATFGVKASAPPRRAAPINLSALPRESVPLARPLASSSKDRLVVSWLTCCPLSQKGGTRGLAPPSCTTKVSMRGYKAWRNFRESPKGEVRRIPIPRTPVNKGKRKDQSYYAPALPSCFLLILALGLAARTR